jgi:hypothetical protein
MLLDSAFSYIVKCKNRAVASVGTMNDLDVSPTAAYK